MKNITPRETYDQLQAGKICLIDVREQEEYDQAAIEGAILAPLSNLVTEIENIKIPDNQPVIFQCRSGVRSAQAIEYLEQNLLKGYELYNMAGGILAWIEDGLPIIQGS